MTATQRSIPFGHLLAALEPWLGQIVIVGGWAHQLYRLHPDAQALDYPPLSTLDTDIALPANVSTSTWEQDIRKRLLTFGFQEEFLGESHPPATHYHLGGEASGFYAEFLTPLVGAEYDRRRKKKSTMEIAGVSSQQLRHIELLLHRPWPIAFECEELAATVQIANPVAFLAQKILIHRRRHPEDRPKDILYMRDTLEVFGARLDQLAELWRNGVAPRLQPRGLNAIRKAPETMFGKLSDDVRRAAEISLERGLTPEAIREACRQGLSQVFGNV